MAKKTVKQVATPQEPTLATLLQFLQELREENRASFQKVDQRFEQVDKRFEQVDQRFEQQDKRFAQQDQRFLGQDQRFQSLEALILRIEREIRKDMNTGFEVVTQRIDREVAEVRKDMNAGFEGILARIAEDNKEGGEEFVKLGEFFRKRIEPLEKEFPALKNSLEDFQRIVLFKLDEHGRALEEIRSSHGARLDRIEAELEELHAQ